MTSSDEYSLEDISNQISCFFSEYIIPLNLSDDEIQLRRNALTNAEAVARLSEILYFLEEVQGPWTKEKYNEVLDGILMAVNLIMD